MCKRGRGGLGSMIRSQHHQNAHQWMKWLHDIPSTQTIDSIISNYIHEWTTLTLFSGNHILVTLSVPTAANFFPSQLQATWVMPWYDVMRVSRGLKAGKFCAYEWTQHFSTFTVMIIGRVQGHLSPQTWCAAAGKVEIAAEGSPLRRLSHLLRVLTLWKPGDRRGTKFEESRLQNAAVIQSSI